MKREEQIQHEAWKYSNEIESRSYDARPDWEDHRWAFESGAEWADTHPNWHKYLNEKPTSIPMLFTYIIWDGDEFHIASWNGYHFYDRFNPLVEDKYVKFWMLLPEPPDLD